MEQFLKRIYDLIELGEETLRSAELVEEKDPDDEDAEIIEYYVDEMLFHQFRASALTFLNQLFGKKHFLTKDFNEQVFQATVENLEIGIGMMKSVQVDLENGHLDSARSLITGEVFSDFLDMAEHLLEEDYKDPAAVLTGGVLEDHLRKLCQSHNIDSKEEKVGKTVPRKSDRLNSDLAKSGAYGKQDLKMVTGWLNLRNHAAHGEYDKYTQEEVRIMLMGVRDFVSRLRIKL